MTNQRTSDIGYQGKELVIKYLQKLGYRIIPNSSVPSEYIDFSVENPKNLKVTKIFVRTDTRIAKTNNIVIERFMHRTSEGSIEIGWLFNGKADILYYLDAYYGYLYCLDWQKLKKYVVENCKATSFYNAIDSNTIGDAYLISVDKIIQQDCFISKNKIDVTSLFSLIPNKNLPSPF
jgi:hypothetical protein